MTSRNITLIALASAVSILAGGAFAASPDRPQSSLEYRELKRDQFNELMFGASKDYFCSLELEQREQLMRQALAIATRINPLIKETLDNVLRETEVGGGYERKDGESALVAYACNSDLANLIGKFQD